MDAVFWLHDWWGNILLEGEGGTSGGDFDRIHFQGRNVASIHSHPKGYYSFPLPNNFDILENEFGDFEIIVSVGVIWIVGFNGCVEKEVRQKFQFCIGKDMDKIYHKVKSKFDDENIVNSLVEFFIGHYLLNNVDKKINNINLVLIRKEV